MSFQPRLGVQSTFVSNGQESIEFLMNLTEPSPKVQLTPPGWRLIMLRTASPVRPACSSSAAQWCRPVYPSRRPRSTRCTRS